MFYWKNKEEATAQYYMPFLILLPFDHISKIIFFTITRSRCPSVHGLDILFILRGAVSTHNFVYIFFFILISLPIFWVTYSFYDYNMQKRRTIYPNPYNIIHTLLYSSFHKYFVCIYLDYMCVIFDRIVILWSIHSPESIKMINRAESPYCITLAGWIVYILLLKWLLSVSDKVYMNLR